MSDATILTIVFALLAAIAPTIASLAAYKKASAVDEKQDELAIDTKEIHAAVNSNLEKMKAELKVANDQNGVLQAMVAQLLKVVGPIAEKNGAEPTFPPVADAVVDKIVKAVEAKTATVPPAVESKKLSIEENEAAKIVITKDETK